MCGSPCWAPLLVIAPMKDSVLLVWQYNRGRMDGETTRDESKRSVSIKTAVALLSLAVRAPF
ncbi:hypothetical protein NC651_020285 [Populus alba x Populus x berolinensis]|nr:hypothetical protein NC651_020285 [Populus alba x Populus x berolinensis]